jgi:hypothetical protein
MAMRGDPCLKAPAQTSILPEKCCASGPLLRHDREVKKAVLFTMTLLRHLLAIAILPFTVAVLVPFWIALRYGVTPTFGRQIGFLLVQAGGCGLFGIGLVLFVGSVWQFAMQGKGTLAPWDPPRVFVARGPY